jgi:hypothetical protein
MEPEVKDEGTGRKQDDEVAAIGKCVNALKGLDDQKAMDVVLYLANRYVVSDKIAEGGAALVVGSLKRLVGQAISIPPAPPA